MLRLVCTGAPGAAQDSYRQIAQDMGLGDAVVFPGFLPVVPKALLEMLSKADSAASQRAISAVLKMKKLDIFLQRAYEKPLGGAGTRRPHTVCARSRARAPLCAAHVKLSIVK